jgi:hypothetical protein
MALSRPGVGVVGSRLQQKKMTSSREGNEDSIQRASVVNIKNVHVGWPGCAVLATCGVDRRTRKILE